jgi:rhodanese-related sulfurtransferase
LTYQVDGTKILGAIHIPPGEFASRAQEIPPDRLIVMYCT